MLSIDCTGETFMFRPAGVARLSSEDVSVKLFHSPQSGHLPSHFGSLWLQLPHIKYVFFFAKIYLLDTEEFYIKHQP